MAKEIVLIGIGEIGGIFARGFLKLGFSVHPVTRQTVMQETAKAIAQPELVVIAVGETELKPVLARLPENWRDKLCLLQNELLPRDWQGIDNPTVISIWFEKKPGMDAKAIIPSPVYGPAAELVSKALQQVAIPSTILKSDEDLLNELVVKNLYILTSNIAGLKTGGSVGELWQAHRQFATDIALEVIRLQEKLSQSKLDAGRLIERLVEAFDGDPEHKCMGRSAPARLARALSHADSLDLELPTIASLKREGEPV